MRVHVILLALICLIEEFVYGKYGGNSLKNKNKYYIIISEILIFFVIALRSYSVGLDTIVYRGAYYKIMNDPTFATRVGWEPLYVLVNRLAVALGSFQWVLVICAAITCFGFGYFAYHNTSKDESLFWFIFFYITLNLYFNSMHLLRQICAMAFCVNIYTVMNNDGTKFKFVKAFVLIFLGLGFHISAVFSVIYIIPFIVKKVDRSFIFNIIIISIVGILLVSVSQELLIRLVPRFSRYINDDRLVSSRSGIYSVVMILLKIFFIIFTLQLDPDDVSNHELYQLTSIIVISTAFYILQFRTQFALRLGYYYEIFMPIYIPAFVRKVRGKENKKIMFALMFVFGLTYFFYMMLIGGTNSNRGTIPYMFFWEV